MQKRTGFYSYSHSKKKKKFSKKVNNEWSSDYFKESMLKDPWLPQTIDISEYFLESFLIDPWTGQSIR